MKNTLPVIALLALGGLLFIGVTTSGDSAPDADTPEGAAQLFFQHIHDRDYDAAYAMVAPESNLERDAFLRDVAGSNESLRTVSTLQRGETKMLDRTNEDSEVRMRATLEWATAVGVMSEQRDLRAVRRGRAWQIVWPAPQTQIGEVRAEKTDYLRWDIIQRSGDQREDWGAQNVEPPRPRVVSMNAVETKEGVVIMGEVVNEDTVPGFVTVSAALIDHKGNPFVEESSFDKISHTLLPKEVSPFRIDFPGVKLAQIRSVRINPLGLLVPAYADPVIGVMNQKLTKDANGRTVLEGELVNQSGQVVNIPHVLATFYDNAGRVIWVSDGYVQNALLPNTPVTFALDVRDEVAQQAQNYRVTVNHYTSERI